MNYATCQNGSQGRKSGLPFWQAAILAGRTGAPDCHFGRLPFWQAAILAGVILAAFLPAKMAGGEISSAKLAGGEISPAKMAGKYSFPYYIRLFPLLSQEKEIKIISGEEKEKTNQYRKSVFWPSTHKPSTHKPSTHKPSTHKPSTHKPGTRRSVSLVISSETNRKSVSLVISPETKVQTRKVVSLVIWRNQCHLY